MATSSTRSPKKPAARVNATLLRRLLRIKAQPIDQKLVEAASRMKPLTPREIAQVVEMSNALRAEAQADGLIH